MTQVRHEIYQNGQLVDVRMVDVDPLDDARATMISRASAALAANSAYLALSTPTAAQTTAQVQRLAKQVNALVKLVLRSTDTIDT